MTASVEFRAKRTHARRSCDLCKLRKTRCELPDLEITATSEPQPYEKSCHRCQVLSLPCVVDDTKGKAKSKLDDLGLPMIRSGSASGSGSRDRAASPKKRKTARASNGSTHTGDTKTLASIVNDSLELMHSFDEELDPALRKPSAASTPTGFGVIPGSMSGDWQVERERSMKYHGRPAELVAAMLTVAYGRVRTLAPRHAFATEVDLERLIDEPTRTRLEPGYVTSKDEMLISVTTSCEPIIRISSPCRTSYHPPTKVPAQVDHCSFRHRYICQRSSWRLPPANDYATSSHHTSMLCVMP
jgi:hypothetical protein